MQNSWQIERCKQREDIPAPKIQSQALSLGTQLHPCYQLGKGQVYTPIIYLFWPPRVPLESKTKTSWLFFFFFFGHFFVKGECRGGNTAGAEAGRRMGGCVLIPLPRRKGLGCKPNWSIFWDGNEKCFSSLWFSLISHMFSHIFL